jgi:hypothetical protein
MPHTAGLRVCPHMTHSMLSLRGSPAGQRRQSVPILIWPVLPINQVHPQCRGGSALTAILYMHVLHSL